MLTTTALLLFLAELLSLNVQVRNEKAGRYLRSMRLKKSIRFSHRFPHDDPLDLRILQKLLSFELNERPTVEEVLHKILLLHSL